MNNVTREKSIVATPASGDEDGAGQPPVPEPAEGPAFTDDRNAFTDVLKRLDEVRYSPRASTLKAIFRHAGGSEKVEH